MNSASYSNIFSVNPSSLIFSAVVNGGDPSPEAIDIYSNEQAPRSWAAKGNSLAGFEGQEVRIQFRTKTDSSAITRFRIDDVQLK